MPPISNIGDVTAGKSFTAGNTLNNNRGSEQGGEQFSVNGAEKSEQIKVVSEKNSNNSASTTMGQKDLIPLAITTAKNQALAVETVKDIINTDLLSTAKLNGYTELVGELEHLSATLYIPAQDLVKEMMDQEKENTMYSGDKFYDLLRELAKDATDDQKEAIGNVLKAINFSQNKNEITNAVSSNLRFLAEYFSPNRGLSEKLTQLAEKWSQPDAQENFKELRGQTADLMRNLSESLLNDSHTQTLLPIITHNMSKFNTNSAMLREYFGQLLTQIPSYEIRNELSQAFEMLLGKLVKENSFNNYTISEQKNQVENSNFIADNQIDDTISSYLTEKFGNNEYISNSEYIDDPEIRQEKALEDDHSPAERGTVDQKTAELDVPEFKNAEHGMSRQSNIGRSTSEQEAPERAASGYAAPERAVTEGDISERQNYVRGEYTRELPESELPENEAQGGNMTTIDFNAFISDLREGIAPAEDLIKSLVSSVVTDADVNAVLEEQLSNISDPDSMVEYLNNFLEAMPDVPLREQLYEVLEEAVTKMQEEATYNKKPETKSEKKMSSIQALTAFVEKNINHPALKSIDSFNASNLLQSMINAPGVMTPLAHYILPVQIENTRSFGELWVDNDDKSGGGGLGGQVHHHLFLTFDVDNSGRFEIDVYANENKLSVSLLHPTSYGKNVEQLISKINRIAATTRYTISDFKTGILKEPHNLTQIFPKLNERRAGLNVKA